MNSRNIFLFNVLVEVFLNFDIFIHYYNDKYTFLFFYYILQ